MTTKYLLPCECGASVPIEVAQAGQSVSCECGRSLVVPALRAIRQLPRREGDERPTPRRRWNAAQGTLFAVGAMVTLWSLLFAAYCGFLRWRIDTRPPPPDFAQQLVGQVDSSTPEQLYKFWLDAQKFGLPAGISLYAFNCREAARLNRNAFIGLAVAVCGAVVASSSLFLGRRAGRRP